jgi:hypothetical protein
MYDAGLYTRSYEEFFDKYGTQGGMEDLYTRLSPLTDDAGKKLLNIDQNAFQSKYYPHLKKKRRTCFRWPFSRG